MTDKTYTLEPYSLDNSYGWGYGEDGIEFWFACPKCHADLWGLKESVENNCFEDSCLYCGHWFEITLTGWNND